MKIAFFDSFTKDLKRINDVSLRQRIERAIESVELAVTLDQIPQLKKLKGGTRHYRIRVGDYRLGILIAGDLVSFKRCLHRSSVYAYFP